MRATHLNFSVFRPFHFCFSFFLITAFLLLGGSVFAAPQTSFQVQGNISNSKNGQSFVIDLALMKKHAIEYKATDPGFLEDGERVFRGIPLESILQLAGAGEISGVTFIANNAYVTYETLSKIKSHEVMIAFEMDGKPIKKKRGGPFKVMYKQEVDQGFYNWYIHTVLLGTSLSPTLNLKYNNTTRVLTLKDLERLPQTRTIEAPPTPRGFGRTELPKKIEVRAVLVQDLLSLYPEVSNVTFTSLVGSELTVRRDNPEFFSLRILSHFNQTVIDSANGGPYILYFSETIQPNGTLFFLTEIQIE